MTNPATCFALGTALLAGGATGCALDGTGVAAGDPDLSTRLETRHFLELAPTSQVGVCATDATGRELPYVEPTVLGGRAVLRTTADRWLLVEDLEIKLGDVTIPPGEYGDQAIGLTDVELRLGTQLEVEPYWSDDGVAVFGTGDADLLLDWAMILEDAAPWPLATQRLGEADFTVAVRHDANGNLEAEVHTVMPGEVHRLGGVVTFSDLSLTVDAVSAADIH